MQWESGMAMEKTGPLDLVSHVGRPTAEGFQTIEVWESKENYDTFMAEVLPEVMTEVLGDGPPPSMPQAEQFEVHGLVVPGAGIAF